MTPIDYSPTIFVTEDTSGWRATDTSTGHQTRAYDTLVELNAAICDGTAGWCVR